MIEGTWWDYTFHILTAVVAIAIFIISALSYTRHKREKFIYICAAFFLFAVKEIITSFDVIMYHSHTLVGVAHIINFIVIILLFIGVMK